MPVCDFVQTVLVLGGLDPYGGAGILLDSSAARATGAHVAAVLTVATVQDAHRFIGAQNENPSVVRDTMERMLAALRVGAVKTGALGNREVVDVVCDMADRSGFPPLVVDPVMRSTTGGVLLDEGGVRALRDRLLPRAALVTPNLAEAGVLTGTSIEDVDGMVGAARRIRELGVGAVLVKGGHLPSGDIIDVFVDNAGEETLFPAQIRYPYEVRGTGCALASLISGFLATGNPLDDAVVRAREFLGRLMGDAVSVGPGPRVLGFSRGIR